MNDSATDHPHPDELRAFDQGRLGPAEWTAIERHLLTCVACCDQIQKLPEQRLADLLGEYDPERPCRDTADGLLTPSELAGPPCGTALEVPPELVNHPRYRIEGFLGRGGMGMVFKAEHRLMQRPVALKVIHPRLLDRPAAVERFRREVRAAARLAHPNIVTAHDADQAGALHFLIVEYVDGETLDQVVGRRGPLPVAEACAYARQAALGLQHAHEQGMIHRDLKPSNLIVTRAGQEKILDFGLAQLAQEGQDGAGLTPDGVLLGTPAYLAPEQARTPAAAGSGADLYSLGCTLYFLLAGRPPFLGDGLLQQLLAHQDQNPRPLSAFRGDVPAGLARVVARLLAKDPANRFPSAAQLAEALAPFAADAPARASGGRRRVPGVALVVLGLAMVAGGGLFAWRWAGQNAVREIPTEPPLPATAGWSDRPSARDQAVAWLKENSVAGPDHPVVADVARLIDQDAREGRAFLVRLGAGLVRSGKPTQLAGRHHDLYAFPFTPAQTPGWVRPKASDFCVSSVPRQQIAPRPLVQLSFPRIDRSSALDPAADITGTIEYRKWEDVSGTLTLRLTCITARGTRTLFEAMPELKLAARGRIGFNLGSLFNPNETDHVPRGPAVFFLELGRQPAPGSEIHMVLLSNMVAVPVFFKK